MRKYKYAAPQAAKKRQRLLHRAARIAVYHAKKADNPSRCRYTAIRQCIWVFRSASCTIDQAAAAEIQEHTLVRRKRASAILLYEQVNVFMTHQFKHRSYVLLQSLVSC